MEGLIHNSLAMSHDNIVIFMAKPSLRPPPHSTQTLDAAIHQCQRLRYQVYFTCRILSPARSTAAAGPSADTFVTNTP